jgi:hypothetical protein
MTKPSAKPSGEASQLKPVGRYRKVEVRTWGDEKFRALSPIPACGAGLWLYLITGPHTGPIPGLFRAGRAGMAEELGWELEAFDKAFEEVTSQGMVKADLKARVMWIPNAIRCNRPESPNVVKSWASEFDLIPECDLKREAYASLREALLLLDPTYVEAFDSHLNKPSPKPSPKPSAKAIGNQEQEQQQDSGAATGAGVDGAATPAAITGAPPPAPPAPPPAADAASPRGTRLPKPWALPKPWGEAALAKYPHWTPDIVRAIAKNFANYWHEKTGKDATKITWEGTWENWCDSDITQRQYPPPKTADQQRTESVAKAERIRRAIEETGGLAVPASQLAPEVCR